MKSAIWLHLFEAQGYRTAGFSIDDLYKTHAEREKLKEVCSHFRFRGPPGTHDVELGLRVIKDLRLSREQGSASVPVFDKSLHNGDGDRLPEEEWRNVQGKIDILIFDGWCVGAQPVEAAELEVPINDIEASRVYDDGAGTFSQCGEFC